jgi:hypothetical protein
MVAEKEGAGFPGGSYGTSFSLGCSAAGAEGGNATVAFVTLAPGGSETCTITNTENDAQPPPTPQPEPLAQCSDGIDNDGDTFVDLVDPGCTDPTDNDESPVNPI